MVIIAIQCVHKPFTEKKTPPGKEWKLTKFNLFEFEFKDRIPQPGQRTLRAHFISDSYIGFDTEVDMTFIVKPANPNKKLIEYSKEDKDEVAAPSAMQLMMDPNAGEDSDSEIEDMDALKAKLIKEKGEHVVAARGGDNPLLNFREFN